MCNTYPTLDMIVFNNPVAIPQNLKSQLKERYDERGGKYATEEIDEGTGLPINNCMNTSSWKECEEELIDAVFNLLVACFRLRAMRGKAVGSDLVKGQELLGAVVAAWGTSVVLNKEVALS